VHHVPVVAADSVAVAASKVVSVVTGVVAHQPEAVGVHQAAVSLRRATTRGVAADLPDLGIRATTPLPRSKT